MLGGVLVLLNWAYSFEMLERVINVMGAYAGFGRTASVYVFRQTGCMIESRVFCQSVVASRVWPFFPVLYN